MEDCSERTAARRPTRSRRYSRKSNGVNCKVIKRLFTPEIKRFLKEWLVRRRDNPYPNRDEKKQLAVETGLTYIQICNWFANWRRKLKNASEENKKKTWGHLIKTYNNKARGNVEQFSICSEDSIWGEPEPNSPDTSSDLNPDHCYTYSPDVKSQYFQFSSTTECTNDNMTICKSPKYKNHIMEKYLKGLQMETENKSEELGNSELSKWLESTAKFQPAPWKPSNKISGVRHSKGFSDRCYYDCRNYVSDQLTHGREEVEAAVALTRLAGAYRL